MLSIRCREFIDLLHLPGTLATVLEEKLTKNNVDLDQSFEVTSTDNGPRLVSQRDLVAFEDLWVVPNALLTTRSKLYQQLKVDSIRKLLLKSFRVDSTTEDNDVLFEEFWKWCSACDYGVDYTTGAPEELDWHLWQTGLLWIPHADSPNVIVRGLPTVISETLDYDIFKNSAAVLCPVCNIEAGQILKRDYLPQKRTISRISRLLTLIGNQPDRWAHLSELEGLKQLSNTSSPLPSAKTDDVKPNTEGSESRPLAAMTEFTPQIRKANIADNLKHPAFEIVDDFSLSNILFAASPVDNFTSLGHRFVNQFPKEGCLLSPRFVLHSVRGDWTGTEISDPKMEVLYPDWFPLSFDLNSEVKWFLESFDKQQDLWLLISGEIGVFDWCITASSETIVKYMEANSGNWVVEKLIPNPMLINGRKFILSLHLLVRSFQPMQAFLYNRMNGRIAKKPYSTAAEFLSDDEVHLPFNNYHAQALKHEELVSALEEQGLKWDELLLQLVDIVSELLKSVASQVRCTLIRLDSLMC
eukprot:g2170.t1